MTIRWKLNLAMTILLLIILISGGVALHAVTETGDSSRSYSRTRELSTYTSDVRTHVFEHLATEGRVLESMDPDGVNDLATHVVQDVEVQVNLSQNKQEREAWSRVLTSLRQLAAINLRAGVDPALLDTVVKQADDNLWKLRNYYELKENDEIVAVTNAGLFAHTTIIVAGILAVTFFLFYLILVREWLVKPVEILKRSAETIGNGNLDHRVPLHGEDEMSQLARQLDSMAASLERHQIALLESRELTSIGELCTNVAHGLRNPLAAIRACAQLAERVLVGSEDARELLQDLVKQADRMDDRINRMFQFSQPGEVKPIATTFGSLVSAVASETQAITEAAKVQLVVEDKTEDLEYQLDHEQLVHATAELVRNAVFHSTAGKRVVLRGERLLTGEIARPGLKLQVIDEGAGMAPVTMNKAFDLFFTSRPNGTGMGLAMVRRLVERHGGSISLASERGVGTTVTITLPGELPAGFRSRRTGISPSRMPLTRISAPLPSTSHQPNAPVDPASPEEAEKLRQQRE